MAKDGGKDIIAGNEKVIRARLSDAKFFWEQDLKKPLEEMATSSKGITFHEKLGTQKERVERDHRAGAPDRRLASMPMPEDARRARRSSPRPISSPAWSASSPSCRG